MQVFHFCFVIFLWDRWSNPSKFNKFVHFLEHFVRCAFVFQAVCFGWAFNPMVEVFLTCWNCFNSWLWRASWYLLWIYLAYFSDDWSFYHQKASRYVQMPTRTFCYTPLPFQIWKRARWASWQHYLNDKRSTFFLRGRIHLTVWIIKKW